VATATRSQYAKLKLAPNIPEEMVIHRVKIWPGKLLDGKKLKPSTSLSGTQRGQPIDCYLPGAHWAALKALKSAGVVPHEFVTPEEVVDRIDVPTIEAEMLVSLNLRKLATDEYGTLVVTRLVGTPPPGHEPAPAPVPRQSVAPARSGTTQPPKPTDEDEGYLDAVLADRAPTSHAELAAMAGEPGRAPTPIEDAIKIVDLMMSVEEYLREVTTAPFGENLEHARAIALSVYIERCKRGKSL